MTAHRPAKAIGLRAGEAGTVHRNLQDLLLVEHDAERLFQDRTQARMKVGHRLFPLLAAQIRMDCVSLDRTGADDRDLDHQVVEGTWP
jgi:hypothetical protein